MALPLKTTCRKFLYELSQGLCPRADGDILLYDQARYMD
jgi:hypothetical protein